MPTNPEVGLDDEAKPSNGDQIRLLVVETELSLVDESIFVGFNRDANAFGAILALFGGEGHLVVDAVVLLGSPIIFDEVGKVAQEEEEGEFHTDDWLGSKLKIELEVVVEAVDGPVEVQDKSVPVLVFNSGLKLSSGEDRVVFQLANNELSLLSGND